MNNNSQVQKAETPIFAHWGLGNGKGYPAPDLYRPLFFAKNLYANKLEGSVN